MLKELLIFQEKGGFLKTGPDQIKKYANKLEEKRMASSQKKLRQLLMQLEIVFVGAYGDICNGKISALKTRNKELLNLLELLIVTIKTEGEVA